MLQDKRKHFYFALPGIGLSKLTDLYVAGFPSLKYVGIEGDFNVMVIDLMGPSLDDLFNFCDQKFTEKSTLMAADQIVS